MSILNKMSMVGNIIFYALSLYCFTNKMQYAIYLEISEANRAKNKGNL